MENTCKINKVTEGVGDEEFRGVKGQKGTHFVLRTRVVCCNVRKWTGKGGVWTEATLEMSVCLLRTEHAWMEIDMGFVYECRKTIVWLAITYLTPRPSVSSSSFFSPLSSPTDNSLSTASSCSTLTSVVHSFRTIQLSQLFSSVTLLPTLNFHFPVF